MKKINFLEIEKMDNGNFTPIYHQLGGNNYLNPAYLPQAQQNQQLDYSYANGKENFVTVL